MSHTVRTLYYTLEAHEGRNYPMISIGYTVRQSGFTVAEWFKSQGSP
jgi:hypothetical protein